MAASGEPSQGSWSCIPCNKSFTTSWTYRRHLQTKLHRKTIGAAADAPTFPCLACGRAFTRDYDRTRHARTGQCRHMNVTDVLSRVPTVVIPPRRLLDNSGEQQDRRLVPAIEHDIEVVANATPTNASIMQNPMHMIDACPAFQHTHHFDCNGVGSALCAANLTEGSHEFSFDLTTPLQLTDPVAIRDDGFEGQLIDLRESDMIEIDQAIHSQSTTVEFFEQFDNRMILTNAPELFRGSMPLESATVTPMVVRGSEVNFQKYF